MAPEKILKLMLRVIGASSMTALIFVAAPYAWMDSIHVDLGLGRLPDQPVVGYLARSLSAFYALMGGLFWVLSFDVRRYRRVLAYLGAAIIFFGGALFVVDRSEGLPSWWTLWEGPFTVAFGAVVLALARRIGRDDVLHEEIPKADNG